MFGTNKGIESANHFFNFENWKNFFQFSKNDFYLFLFYLVLKMKNKHNIYFSIVLNASHGVKSAKFNFLII